MHIQCHILGYVVHEQGKYLNDLPILIIREHR